MTYTVAVAGIPIGVRASRPDDLATLERVLGGCPRLPDDTPLTHHLSWGATPLRLPGREPDLRTVDSRFWLDGSGSTAAHQSGIAGSLVDDDVRIGGRSDDDEPLRPLRIAMQLPLAQLLGRRQRHVVHGALVRRRQQAVLILGDSGSGKSTAAFAAAAAGWEVLADDLSVLERRGSEVVAWGFPKPLHVPGELLDDVPPDAEPIPDDRRRRVAFPAPVSQASTECPVLGVVFVDHSLDRAQLAETALGAAWVRALLRSFLVGATDWGSRQVFTTATALSRLPSIRLLHDADPDRRVGEAARLLTSIADVWAASVDDRLQ